MDEKKYKPFKSVLFNYINKKIKNYDEPTRKGRVPTLGQPIGLSRKKYAATLWLLAGLEIKVIAENVGVSAGLLRKWKTEDVFKKQIKENENEIAEYHCQYLKEVRVRYDIVKKAISVPTKENVKNALIILEMLKNDYRFLCLEVKNYG